MRVTRFTPRTDTRPFNRIFESYGDLLMKYLEERLDADPKSTYVQMPSTQQELIDFALSGSQDVCLLVGDIGVGKSSILRFLKEEVWPSQQCLRLFKDFSADSENVNFPPKFYELPYKAQKQRALHLADSKVIGIIKRQISEWQRTTISADPMDFVRFLERFCPEDVPDDVTLSADDASEVLKSLRAFCENHRRKYWLRCFYYYLYKNDIRHVKFVVDNLDDKEIMLLHSIVELAAHMARGFKIFNAAERRLDPSAPERWISIIAACRPNTADMLQHGDKRNGNRWHGFQEIIIDEPCSLSEMLKKRYQYLIKGKLFAGDRDRSLRFVVAGKSWTVSNRDAFFEGVCEAFNTAGQSRQILELCNNNLAESMRCVLGIIRNRHFVRDEDLLKSVVPGGSAPFLEFARNAFTRTTALRALAYGNQGDVNPVYPINNSPVQNVLDSKVLPFGKSTFKLRVMSMFAANIGDARTIKAAISVCNLCQMGKLYFGLEEDTCKGVIDELCEQGVIGNTRLNALPSNVGGDCTLMFRPRGLHLWQLLADSSILMQCFYDDCDLDTTLSWEKHPANFVDKPTQEIRIEEVGMMVVWLARQLWRVEESEMDRIATAGQYSDFTRLCGEEPVSLRVIRGLENSDKRYFCNYPGADYDAFHVAVGDLRRKIEAAIERWRTAN